MARRKRTIDNYTLFIRLMDVSTWAIIFIALIFFGQARPETQTVLDMRYDKVIRSTWDLELLRAAMWILVSAAAFSLLGLLINLGLLGNKKRHVSVGMSIGFIFSVILAIVFYFILS